MWCLIVWIPDLCTLTYFSQNQKWLFLTHQIKISAALTHLRECHSQKPIGKIKKTTCACPLHARLTQAAGPSQSSMQCLNGITTWHGCGVLAYSGFSGIHFYISSKHKMRCLVVARKRTHNLCEDGIEKPILWNRRLYSPLQALLCQRVIVGLIFLSHSHMINSYIFIFSICQLIILILIFKRSHSVIKMLI